MRMLMSQLRAARLILLIRQVEMPLGRTMWLFVLGLPLDHRGDLRGDNAIITQRGCLVQGAR